MADMNVGGAMTFTNTTVKTTLEAYKILMELLKDCIGLLPNPSVANVMRKEMELGHVNCEMIQLDDAKLMRDALEAQGMKKGVDFIETVYNRPDGERVAAFFYNIKDDEKVRGAKDKVDPQDLANRETNTVTEYFAACGINPDKTIDEKLLKQSLANRGIDINAMIKQNDIATAVSLMSSEFLTLSEAEKTNIAKTLAGNGAVGIVQSQKQTGNVTEKALFDWSKRKPNDNPEISSIKHLTEIEAIAFEKRAAANGLRINVQGPNNGSDFTVFFASRDRDLMNRAYAETNYDLLGKAGDIYKKQLNFEANYHKQAINSFINQQMPNDKELPNHYMLVGMKIETLYDNRGNPIIDPKTNEPMKGRNTLEYNNGKWIINGNLKETNPNVKTIISPNHEGSAALIKNLFSDTNPTILTDKQAADYKNEPNETMKMNILYDAQTRGENGFIARPIVTEDEHAILQEHEKNRVLVENKLQEQLPDDQKMAAYAASVSSANRFYIDQLSFTNVDNGDKRTNLDVTEDVEKMVEDLASMQAEIDTDLDDTDTFVRENGFQILIKDDIDQDHPVNDNLTIDKDKDSLAEEIDKREL